MTFWRIKTAAGREFQTIDEIINLGKVERQEFPKIVMDLLWEVLASGEEEITGFQIDSAKTRFPDVRCVKREIILDKQSGVTRVIDNYS